MMEAVLIGLLLLSVLLGLWYASLLKKRNTAHEALARIDTQLKQYATLVAHIFSQAQALPAEHRRLMPELHALSENTAIGLGSDHNNGCEDKNTVKRIRRQLAQADALSATVAPVFLAMETAVGRTEQTRLLLGTLKHYRRVQARICRARRFYNSAVTELNTSVQFFPGSLIAKMTMIGTMPFFEARSMDPLPVNIGDILN